ncbi:MAG: DUF86 domain-containing protein [Thermomicrobiales bacterium]|nr:DUF86 domain-containing protein [Thermomicrobiales bacterium]
MSFDEFVDDELRPHAVLHLFMIAGEASRRLSPELRAQASEDLFRQAIAMRNFVVHQYDDVEFETVWKSLNEDIPALQMLVSQLLALFDTESSDS